MRASTAITAVLFLSVGLLLGGCKSTTPVSADAQTKKKPSKFDTRAGKPAAVTNLTSVVVTNRLKEEWLKPPKEAFTLGPGDVIEIEPIGDPAGRAMASVGPDGRIYYSLLSALDVWGLTLTQTKQLLEKELQRYQKEAPQLVVTLRAVSSKRVWLLGRFNAPGVYPMAAPMTVLEAVSLAGGIGNGNTFLGGAGGVPATAVTVPTSEDNADLRQSFILRNGQFITVDFEQLLKAGDLSQNIYLQPDDFVYVKSEQARVITVMGHVRQPSVVPYRDKMSLMTIMTMLGGPTPDAYLTHVAIVRGALAKPSIAIVDYKAISTGFAPDVLLEPNDIIHVPKSPYALIESYLDMILTSFVRTVAINAGQRAVYPNSQGVGVSIPGISP